MGSLAMQGNLIIKPQRYPTATGETPLSYGIFLETSETIEGLECWQDCEEIFVAYSWSYEGAVKAISEMVLGCTGRIHRFFNGSRRCACGAKTLGQ